MKYIVLSLTFLFTITLCLGQNVNFEWVKTLKRSGSGDLEEHLIGVDASKNVYISGHFTNTQDLDPGPGVYEVSTKYQTDIFVVKLDPKGNFIWGRQLGGPRADEVYSMAVDAAGNTYLTGFFDGPDADFDPGPGVYYLNSDGRRFMYICKLDVDGNFAWAKQFGGVHSVWGLSIAVDKSGNVYSAGGFSAVVDFDPGPGVYLIGEQASSSPYISKLDNDGNFVWAKALQTDYFGTAYYLRLDNEDNIYLTGNFQRSMDFDTGPGKYILGDILNQSSPYFAKFDRNGNFIWGKKDVGNSPFAVDSKQNIYLFTPINGSGNGYITKLDTRGDTIWSKRTGSGVGKYEFSTPIQVDAAGNIYTAGAFRYTQDFDPGPGVFNLSNFSGNYFLSDICISKLDTDGNFIWAKQIGGWADDTPHGLELDGDGNIYTIGTFFSRADFDPGPEVYDLMPGSGGDMFIHKMSNCNGRSDTTLTKTACYSYLLNGISYNTTGVYFQYLANVSGCDSVITLDLTITASETTTTIKACDSYVWEGQTYSASGLYTVSFPKPNGCDSIRHLNLTIGHNSSTTVIQTLCDWTIDYEGYSASGVYIDSFKSVTGCDSIRTLYLTFKPPSISTTIANICQGEDFWGYTESGTYQDLFLTAEGCDSTRILQLTVNPTSTSFQNITICEGESWFAGGTYQTTAGTYRDVFANYTGCDSIVITNLVVHPAPVVDFGADRDLCAGTSLILDPGIFSSYLWQDQSAMPRFFADKAGTYWVTVRDNNNCVASDTIIITKIFAKPSDFLQPSDSICENEKKQIIATGNYRSYSWSTSSLQPFITVELPGLYTLEVEDFNGCIGSDTITVTQKTCNTGIFIPSAFSPNNDQNNDQFRAKVYGLVTSFRLEVYDRNGQLIFRTTDPQSGWNGTYKGIALPTSVFVWQCFYQLQGREPGYQKGSVTLLRN